MSIITWQKLAIDINRNIKTVGGSIKTKFVVVLRALFATLKGFPTYPKLFESV